MIRHVALFRWNAGVTPEQVAELAAALAALPSRLHGLRDFRFGPDAGLVEGNADFAVVADFDDSQAYLNYRHHPAHQDVLQRLILPMSGQRMGMQLEI